VASLEAGTATSAPLHRHLALPDGGGEVLRERSADGPGSQAPVGAATRRAPLAVHGSGALGASRTPLPRHKATGLLGLSGSPSNAPPRS
jgi:hypothetical protein